MIRISGPQAGVALRNLCGCMTPARVAKLVEIRDGATLLDKGLALWFPGPGSVTGEDLAELHVHGGRAVVAAVLAALGRMPGLRGAEAGEFTRRGFANGRIDLAEAEGLADLLAAETESQRQSALVLAEGGLGRHVADWQNRLLMAGAAIEAALDFSDEDDVDEAAGLRAQAVTRALAGDIATMLATPPAERLRDGVMVVLAGPPNSGKSSLFNALVDRDAAIVSEIAGTTRDRIEAPIALGGVPLVLVDTAGLRQSNDQIEAMGVARTTDAMARADLTLWLGDAGDCPKAALLIAAKADLDQGRAGLAVSAKTGAGLDVLKAALIDRAQGLLPKPGALALNARHRSILVEVLVELEAAAVASDPLIHAEHLRLARIGLDRLTGRAGVEDMLDALFGRFCIGK
ncbi:MAG: tRNA uridine-5-carboxymethylaminomethyl(34) synthesis GTPase MnmE [Pseudomonadota bacterium]